MARSHLRSPAFLLVGLPLFPVYFGVLQGKSTHCERFEDSYMKTILTVGQNGTLPSFKDDNHP